MKIESFKKKEKVSSIVFPRKFEKGRDVLSYVWIDFERTLDKSFVDEEIEEACMLKRSTFEVSEHGWKVLMVGERRGRSIPGEIQGLKGWPRRWIHSGNSYI